MRVVIFICLVVLVTAQASVQTMKELNPGAVAALVLSGGSRFFAAVMSAVVIVVAYDWLEWFCEHKGKQHLALKQLLDGSNQSDRDSIGYAEYLKRIEKDEGFETQTKWREAIYTGTAAATEPSVSLLELASKRFSSSLSLNVSQSESNANGVCGIWTTPTKTLAKILVAMLASQAMFIAISMFQDPL
eukprot:c4118_g1_i1.p1 GENE.c4118_g1_i1~~c4118_g1_i1.p1  ORF type:complete len:188 (+),score=43.96 c4118_g1_i1:34-597(+)